MKKKILSLILTAALLFLFACRHDPNIGPGTGSGTQPAGTSAEPSTETEQHFPPDPEKGKLIYYAGPEGDNALVTIELKAGEKPVLEECLFSAYGYTFVGWQIGNTLYQPGDAVIIIQNKGAVATAVWEADNMGTLCYRSGDETYTDGPYPTGETVSLLPCMFYRSGYTFIGWQHEGALLSPGWDCHVKEGITMIEAQWKQTEGFLCSGASEAWELADGGT